MTITVARRSFVAKFEIESCQNICVSVLEIMSFSSIIVNFATNTIKMKRFILTFVLGIICATAFSQNVTEQKLIDYGLVDVQMLDKSIQVKLMYSTTDNFTKTDMYGDMERAYLVPEIAEMVVRAQKKLKSSHPKWSLIILDAARPMSVQQFMHDLVDGTAESIYVANPKHGGGRHNYGTAVDLTIVDENGKWLDMGSGFDYFGEASHVGNDQDLLKRGLISKESVQNRKILADLMKSVGFVQHPKEWWHFHKYKMSELKVKYKVLDF